MQSNFVAITIPAHTQPPDKEVFENTIMRFKHTFPLWRTLAAEGSCRPKQTDRASVPTAVQQMERPYEKIFPKWLAQMTIHQMAWKIPVILVTPEPSIARVKGSIRVNHQHFIM